MMNQTANAIKMLLRIDTTVTPDERKDIIKAMKRKKSDSVYNDITADVSIAYAAAYLGISRQTIWRMCCRGDVVAVKRGKKYYISGCEVARLKRSEHGMMKFEPGVAYQFKACIGIGSDAPTFMAVAADRNGRDVDFVVPLDLLSGTTDVIEGRETVCVVRDGMDYFASAAAPAEIGESFKLLNQIRETRASCI